MLAIAMVPGLLLFVGTFFVPASPHWLVAEWRLKEAKKILKYLRETPREVRNKMVEMKKQARAAEGGRMLRI